MGAVEDEGRHLFRRTDRLGEGDVFDAVESIHDEARLDRSGRDDGDRDPLVFQFLCHRETEDPEPEFCR